MTASQKTRDIAFGTVDDDDLSDLDCLPDPPERPQKKHTTSQAKLATTLSNPIVLSSDDDVSSPTRPVRSTKPRKKAIVISDDEIEDVIPPSKISDSSISRRRSVLQMTPLLPSKPQPKPRPVTRKRSRLDEGKLDTPPVEEKATTISARPPGSSIVAATKTQQERTRNDKSVASPEKSAEPKTPLISKYNG